MRYYSLRDDVFSPNVVPNRWHLGEIMYVENSQFFQPTVELMEPGTWPLSIYQDGVETDFTINSGGSPIVSKKIKDALSDIPEIETLCKHTVIEPVQITERELSTEYYVMITEDRVDCVDEEKSEFRVFTLDDPVRPDLAGQYDAFLNLVVDPAKIGNRNIFRVERATSVLIVSDEIKKRFEAVGATGAIFESVMGDRRTIA